MPGEENPRDLLKRTSIIVCTVDRLAELGACLKSLAPFKLEAAGIVVVNNGPDPTGVEAIARQHGATVVHEPRRGVGHARNAGIRAATGSILAFLDDDSTAAPNWLPTLLESLRDPEIFAVVGSIEAQSLAEPASQTLDALHRAQFPQNAAVFDANANPGEFPMRMALVGNANMAIRREAFERFGYFDARFGRGTRIGSGEEPDFLLRILLGGGRIAVEPDARIVHRHSADEKAVKHWAFSSGCAHTAMLTKYFFREPAWRRPIVRYAESRLRRSSAAPSSSPVKSSPPRIPFLLGSLYGPMAYFFSRKR